ncbi:DUF6270 domain-containing protein [Virgibacillus sp. 179-BFC.A HS]|uniref:DUF6270 domain-containing protein n=1 Tax=Tigheibacillus jepli TaxID=3035914 RepID=A0ABU5CEA5_9BACI|nr:DUF6270 domain-containing protein [Virgibacillus sp. 179-BFC.A HS]MDY0404611.1 DUF6270 domain-containing protein [Virgibacillus sp. 179-BFC.A HS]
MSKFKVAVIGSCVSRDIFNRKFIPNYKEMYECVSTAWQTSIISFVSDRTWIPEDQKGYKDELTKHQRNTANRDIAKRYRKEMIEAQPDYILFDLYADVRYGVVKTDKGYLTNNPNGFQKTFYYHNNSYEKTLNIFRDKSYLDLFFQSFQQFLDWVHQQIPNCKVIVNGFYEAFSYMTREDYPVNFSLKVCSMVAKENAMYNKIYEKLIADYDIYFLDMRKRTYFGDYDHLYGRKPWHFTQQYYDDLHNALNNIVMKDQLLDENETKANNSAESEEKKRNPIVSLISLFTKS